MADFRKWLLAFAVAALLFGLGSSTAYAQGFTCNASAAPNTIRSEGVTELVGDLILQCTGGKTTPAGVQIPNANVQLTMTTTITSRLVTAGGNTASEALLLIDEPFPVDPVPSTGPNAQTYPAGAPIDQMACLANNTTNCAIISNGSGIGNTGSYNGQVDFPGPHTGNHYNVFQGIQTSPTQITWTGVPIDAPGTAGVRTIRITNIRTNATQAAVGSSFLPTQLFAQVAVNGGETLIINNPVQVVASVQPGLLSPPSVVTAADYQQCTSVNTYLLGASGGVTADPIDVSATEGFPASFKPRNYDQVLNGPNMEPPSSPILQNVPGFPYYTESGLVVNPDIGAPAQPNDLVDTVVGLEGKGGNFIDPVSGAVGLIGLASQGTQLQFAFTNIGAGVNLFVPNQITLTPALGYTYAPGTLPGFAQLVGTSGGGNSALTITGTSAVAVYEIWYADPAVQEVAPLPVTVAYISNTANNLPATGTGKVSVNFSPLSTNPNASSSAPIPRFVQPYPAVNLYTINPCTCDLLFPFVTNQAGFDTGVAIANTSLDPFGTTPQQGTVTLYYYGGTTGGGAAPPAQTTNDVLPAGQELIFTLSNGGNLGIAATPGFQGYIISIAQFQYCHAFAFISDVGAQKLAEGYLAISLDVPFNLAGTGAGAGNSRTLNFGENDGN
ncbi:MAG TPA: hypothetical protein VMH80_04080 [Bryobacteraceae bacterium]|nr:hypothetical protein [Bryobacteraceae bacterium]